MDYAKFTMIDEDFICEVCGKEVNKLGYTARDHCPYCLSSKHVDINPGDRLCDCKGILKPIEIEKGKKDTYKIVYKCLKCGMIKRNIAAKDDDFDKILEIMSNK
jgi:DNA-directed RNA polymerase subunit RPC12/RpoP